MSSPGTPRKIDNDTSRRRRPGRNFLDHSLGDVEQNIQIGGAGRKANGQRHDLAGDGGEFAGQRRLGCGGSCFHSARLGRTPKPGHLQTRGIC